MFNKYTKSIVDHISEEYAIEIYSGPDTAYFPLEGYIELNTKEFIGIRQAIALSHEIGHLFQDIDSFNMLTTNDEYIYYLEADAWERGYEFLKEFGISFKETTFMNMVEKYLKSYEIKK